jgi:hypothetical protein
MSEIGVPVERDHTHVVNNGKVELTFEQLGFLQPSVARLMLEVSQRYTRGYHAALAKNARLARFQIGEGTKLLRLCAVVQPRYADAVASFVRDHVDPIRDLMAKGDWEALEPAWAGMTEEVNRWHAEFAHGFLVWKVGDTPPPDLDLTPLPDEAP